MHDDPYRIDHTHQRRAAFRLVIVAGVILVMSLSGKKAKERREAKAAEAQAPVPEAVAPREAPVGSGSPRTWAPGERTAVPRPALPTRTRPDAPPVLGSGEPRDEDAELRDALSGSLQAVVPEVRDCLTQWWMLDPELAGALELEFVLDATGLQAVQILDHSEVPVGPMSCFATALYDAEWPRVEGEVTVRQPFRFEN